MAGTTVLITRPMSVKEIAEKAQAFEFNPQIALRYWLRTADMLLREAQIYEQEDNYQQSYLLLMRYAILVADKLSLHPGAKDPEGKRALRAATRAIPDVIMRLEAFKPIIEARYDKWQALLANRRESMFGLEDFRRSRTSFDFAESDPAIAGKSTTLAAAEHRELAVELAHKEIRRRDAARKTAREAGILEEEEYSRRSAGLWNGWEKEVNNGNQAADDDLRRRMVETRRRMDHPHDIAPDGARKKLGKAGGAATKQSPAQISSSIYRYPSVSKPQPLQSDEWPLESRPPLGREYLPPVPAKESLFSSELYNSALPPRPMKEPIHKSPSLTPSPVEEAPAFTFRPSAYLENGSPLRTVFLPPTLRDRFLSIVAPNTRANLETCGILCGTLISNALFISRLVIPEQESTSDTCETINESALFDFCDSEDLMVLGWIHTHPTQTCFMSSRDLHTHCGYQVMMPESIAIVCAPSKSPSWGVFRLTDPPGMQSMLGCRQTGLFHPHTEENVYTDALRPGHVFEAPGLDFEVMDLRPSHEI